MSNPDLPRRQPSIEVDEATGRELTAAAQKALTNFADIMANVADDILRGNMDGLAKIGFDFGVSMAYLELDMQAIVSRMMESAPPEVSEYMDERVIVSFGGYGMPPVSTATGRPVYSDHGTTTVRLYLRNVGI